MNGSNLWYVDIKNDARIERYFRNLLSENKFHRGVFVPGDGNIDLWNFGDYSMIEILIKFKREMGWDFRIFKKDSSRGEIYLWDIPASMTTT